MADIPDYVLCGHINLHNKNEGGAELAVHLNRIMANFHYSPNGQSGIIIKGKVQDDKYKQRMAKLGVIVTDDGTVIDRDPDITQFRAENRPKVQRDPSPPPLSTGGRGSIYVMSKHHNGLHCQF